MARPFAFLSSKPVIVISAVLAVQIAIFYGTSTKEYLPSPPPLLQLADQAGPWQMVRQANVDAETQKVLKADDSLDRNYAGPAPMELFVAFFKTQRAGVQPHSPKVCLPGNGWTPEDARIISIDVPGESAPIPVNRYIVSKDSFHNLVMYWYQGAHRATADEYLSKFYLIVDSLHYHRSDEALIRVVTDAQYETQALQFIRDVYQPLKQHIWVGGTGAAVQPELPGTREPLLAHVR